MSGEFVDAAALTFRFILGFAFFAAAVPKLVAAGDFQRAVANYALLPPVLVRPVASRFLRQLGLTLAAAFGAGAFAEAAHAVGQCCPSCTQCAPCGDGRCYCFCNCGGIGESYCLEAPVGCRDNCFQCGC